MGEKEVIRTRVTFPNGKCVREFSLAVLKGNCEGRRNGKRSVRSMSSGQ